MTFSFHPEADEEFFAAVAYYEGCDSGLGLDFAREVHSKQSSVPLIAIVSLPSH